MNTFTEAHRIGAEQLDRRIAEVSANFDQKFDEMRSQLRLEIVTLKTEILEWTFLLWIGQLAALTAILGVMLRDIR